MNPLLTFKDECRANYSSSGLEFYIAFAGVSSKEKKEFQTAITTKVKFCPFNEIGMFCVKLGNLNWIDMPYSPSIDPNITLYDFDKYLNSSLPLIITCIDSSIGKIISQFSVNLSADFTENFISWAKSKLNNKLVYNQYLTKVNLIYQRYKTSDLIKKAEFSVDGIREISIRKSLRNIGGVRKVTYKELPNDLQDFIYYVPDSGYVVMAVPLVFYNEATKDLSEYECAVPCKYIKEHGYKLIDDHVIVDIPYDKDFGIIYEKFSEF